MRIRIVTVTNKIHQSHRQLIEEYAVRIGSRWKTEWKLVAPSSRYKGAVLEQEAVAILKQIGTGDVVWLLDETGVLLNNIELAMKFSRVEQSAKSLVIIIGGSYGVHETVKSRADLLWSLSPLVYPHQLVQILLSEQIYRTQSILAGHPYHHA